MKNGSWKYLALISQIGMTIVISILMCTVFGYFLDRWLGTKFVFTLIFIIFGSVAGFWSAFQLITKISADDLDK